MKLNLETINVLVIEDNFGDFVLIEEYLAKGTKPYVTSHAKTFSDAKNYILSGSKFDVILLDLTLPDASGEDLINKAVEMASDKPLIVLTGYTDKSFSIKTLSLGVSDYLLKDDLDALQLNKSIAYSIERKRFNTELKISEEKYRNLFHSSPIPIWVYDPETLFFMDVNTSACRHYGYSKEEFLGMTIQDIRPESDKIKVGKIVARHKNTEEYYEGTFDHLKKNGQQIYVNIQSNSINFSGKRARLVVATDITEKIKVQHSLKLSEQRFKALVQEGSDLICILDKRGIYKYVSPTSESILGMSSEQFIGKSVFDFIHPEDKNKVVEKYKLIFSEKRVDIPPFRFKSSDNTYYWIESVVTNMMDDSSIRGIVANSRNVSDRYTYEEKIRKQDSLFRAITEKGSDMKTLITPEGKIIFATPSITKILGYSREEYIGMNEKDFVHPDHINELKQRTNLTISNQSIFDTMQLRIRTKQGEFLWCERTTTNLLHDPDVNALVCHFWDITEKRKAEIEIKESKDRYDLVSKATRDAIWDYTFANNRTYIAGSGYKQLFGYDIVDQFTNESFWENRLHPEDKEIILRKLKEFICDLTQTQCEYEYRLLKADGEYAYVNDRLFIIREDDIPLRIIGSLRDISKRKAEEQHLKLLESIITNANDAVLITEAKKTDSSDPKIIYVNEALTKISGYNKNEILGKTPSMFQGPKSDRVELRRLKNAFENNLACKTEVINYTKQGKPYWIDIDIAPVTDNTGNVSHFIAIERDVTSRKIQEHEREKLIFELLQTNKDLRQFSYITSHNLRGPIAHLLGLTNLLENYKIKDPTLIKIFAGIKKSALNFDETIKDLADILNIKDHPSIPKENILFTAIHNKALVQYDNLLKENNTIIQVDFSEAPSINFNKSYLESIYSNLLTNAIKYRKRTIALEITIKSELHGNYTHLKFQDNGRGIDLETHKEKIFGLYQRFHSNTQGKGLGLFLVKSQIEALNGSIDIESQIDEGSLFTLRFKNN